MVGFLPRLLNYLSPIRLTEIRRSNCWRALAIAQSPFTSATALSAGFDSWEIIAPPYSVPLAGTETWQYSTVTATEPFNRRRRSTRLGTALVAVAVGDMDDDGHLDLVALNTTSHALVRGLIGVLRGDGTGAFRPAETYSTGGRFPSALANIKADNRPDLVVTNGNDSIGDGTIAVLLRTTK